ncbi:MAG: FtsX-like permease family protein, partial [Verrucomicrobiota bacterium]
MLTVALGIAVFLAIQIVNHSAYRAFSAGIDMVAGKSHLEVVGPGTHDLDESVFPKISSYPEVRAATPLAEGYVSVSLPDQPGEYLHILGIDPFTSAEFQTWRLSIGAEEENFDPEAWLRDRDTVYLSKPLGEAWNLQAGDTLEVQRNGETTTLKVGFLYREADADDDQATPDRIASMDIGWFQEFFGTQEKISSIQVLLENPNEVETVKADLEEMLGSGFRVRRPNQRSDQVEVMLSGFKLNLTALSMVSILVGVFLIYNASSAGVVRRRRELGILRSVGATRRQIMGLVLGEAAILGAIGVLLGIFGARLLAAGLLGGVSQVISLQYVLLSIDRTYLSPLHLGQAVVFGLAASLAGAWFPAR